MENVGWSVSSGLACLCWPSFQIAYIGQRSAIFVLHPSSLVTHTSFSSQHHFFTGRIVVDICGAGGGKIHLSSPRHPPQVKSVRMISILNYIESVRIQLEDMISVPDNKTNATPFALDYTVRRRKAIPISPSAPLFLS